VKCFRNSVVSNAQSAVWELHTNRKSRSSRVANSSTSNSARKHAEDETAHHQGSDHDSGKDKLRSHKAGGFRRSQRVDLDHCGDRISIGTVLGHL
jgi:hypothetical protein